METEMNSRHRKLIIKHARLVAKLSDDISEEDQAKIRTELSEIEKEINLTPQEIADKAVLIYKERY